MKNIKTNYGQELIPFLWVSTIVIILLIGLMICLGICHMASVSVIITLAGIACFFAFLSLMSIWSSRVGKLIMRDKLIKELSLKGNEQLLDVGCGKGLLTVGIAKQLTTGEVIGLDHWKSTLEYTYTSEMAERNANIENVTNRVRFVTGDAQQLPFEKERFDLITSSLAMHHVPDSEKAFAEMFRVVRKGGRIAIADMPTAKIKRQMTNAGFEIQLVKPLVRLFFIKVHLIIAKKK